MDAEVGLGGLAMGGAGAYGRCRNEGSFPRALAERVWMAERTGLVGPSSDVREVARGAVSAEASPFGSSEVRWATGERWTLGAEGLSSRSPASQAHRRTFHRSGPA